MIFVRISICTCLSTRQRRGRRYKKGRKKRSYPVIRVVHRLHARNFSFRLQRKKRKVLKRITYQM